MLLGNYSNWLLQSALVLMLGACGSGDDDAGSDAGDTNAGNHAPSNNGQVVGQSNTSARFDQTVFSNASFAVEASSGRYGTDMFR